MSLLTPTTTLFPYTTLFRSNAGNIFQFFADPVLQRFRVDQLQFNPAVFARRRVGKRFVNAFVGVLQMNVFADDSDLDALLRTDDAIDKFFPARQVWLRSLHLE